MVTKSRGINAPRTVWTAGMDALLRHLYPFSTTHALGLLFRCEKHAVYNRAYRLGIKKSPWFFKAELSGRLSKDNNQRGIGTRFHKGQVSHNKGVKGVCYPGSVATQFKPSHMPHNTLDVGTYRLDKDQTLQRKIGEAKGSNSKRWRGVHELVWVEANGPVPEKHIVIFKPGMRTNKLEEITLDKVECISLAENMRRNSYHNYGPDIAKVYQLKGAIQRKINRMEKQKNG